MKTFTVMLVAVIISYCATPTPRTPPQQKKDNDSCNRVTIAITNSRDLNIVNNCALQRVSFQVFCCWQKKWHGSHGEIVEPNSIELVDVQGIEASLRYRLHQVSPARQTSINGRSPADLWATSFRHTTAPFLGFRAVTVLACHDVKF